MSVRRLPRATRALRIASSVAAVGLLLAALWVRLGPLPQDLLASAEDLSTVVVDRHGEMLYEARAGAGARRDALDPARLPPVLVAATLAAEDRRFHWHPGVDPLALSRAVVQNLRAGRVVEGGSTITQQVAKLLLASRAGGAARPRGVRAKLQEALVALRLEHRLGKNEILALYLSVAPYGNQISGARRAAKLYFGVEPQMLTAAQAAFLAALPHRPSAYNPYRDRGPATRRQRAILSRMAAHGWLPARELDEARSEGLRFVPLTGAFRAPHFVEMVLAGHQTPLPRRIHTTIDARLQAEVEGIVRSHRPQLARHDARNVAIVVLDNHTAEWRAWEGSGDYTDGDHGGAINGPLVARQPGSALKPFTYALAFETGDTPATVLPDVPASFPTAEPGIVYTPRNYDGTFRGPLRIRKALAGSQNVPAVALASRIGVADLLQFFRQAGFKTLDKTASHYGLGLTLGNAEVRLAELVAAYAAVARGGVFIEPRSIVSDARATRTTRRILSARTAFWVTDVLSDDEAREYVFGRGGSLEFPFPVAAKTGTSQAYHDNWAIGYTRDVTVGVWVGNFDRRPLVGSSGVTGAGPLFHAVMLAAQARLGAVSSSEPGGIVQRPAGLAPQVICELSGMPAGPACPLRRREWLPPAIDPPPCDWHHGTEEGLLTFYPPEYEMWARRRGGFDAGPPPGTVLARTSGTPAASAEIRLRQHRPRARGPEIASPADGSTYLMDPTLRAEFQTLPLRAIAEGPIEWRVDGIRHAGATDNGEVHWPLRRGSHRIAVRDGRGREAEVTIVVK